MADTQTQSFGDSLQPPRMPKFVTLNGIRRTPTTQRVEYML